MPRRSLSMYILKDAKLWVKWCYIPPQCEGEQYILVQATPWLTSLQFQGITLHFIIMFNCKRGSLLEKVTFAHMCTVALHQGPPSRPWQLDWGKDCCSQTGSVGHCGFPSHALFSPDQLIISIRVCGYTQVDDQNGSDEWNNNLCLAFEPVGKKYIQQLECSLTLVSREILVNRFHSDT